MSQNVPCPICYSEKTKFLFEGYDHWLGYPDPASVYSCKECEHVFIAGELTPEQLSDMYTNYYPRSNFNVEDYQPYTEKKGLLYWLDGEEGLAHNHVPKNVRVLDIGCGYCETLGYHKNRGCDAYGVEADENAKKIADKYGFNVEIGLFDPTKYEPNSFDYVTMNYVLEHLVSPLNTLRDIQTVLKQGGCLIATVPNPRAFGRYFFGQYWINWHLPFHRHFYSRKSVTVLAEAAGFEPKVFRSATESAFLLSTWARLFCLGARGKKAPDVALAYGRFDEKMKTRWDVTLFLFLKKIRLFCLSMKIADMLSVGDCNLIILQKR